MPTQSKSGPKSDPITDSVEVAAERVSDLYEKSVASSQKATERAADLYEKSVASSHKASERVADLHEKSVASSKKAGEAYLSSYEKAVVALADSYEKATGATRIEWIANLGSLQADTTRELTRAYTTAVRDLVS